MSTGTTPPTPVSVAFGFSKVKLYSLPAMGLLYKKSTTKRKATTVAWVRRGFVGKVNSSLRKVGLLVPLNGLECGGGGAAFVSQL